MPGAGEGIYPGLVLELSSLDLEEIADALSDQTDYEHRWLTDPQAGEIVFWTATPASTARRQSRSRSCRHDYLNHVGGGPRPSGLRSDTAAEPAPYSRSTM